MNARMSDDIRAAYLALGEPGRTYLLGWLVGAIEGEGKVTLDTLRAAVPLAQNWDKGWKSA